MRSKNTKNKKKSENNQSISEQLYENDIVSEQSITENNFITSETLVSLLSTTAEATGIANDPTTSNGGVISKDILITSSWVGGSFGSNASAYSSIDFKIARNSDSEPTNATEIKVSLYNHGEWPSSRTSWTNNPNLPVLAIGGTWHSASTGATAYTISAPKVAGAYTYGGLSGSGTSFTGIPPTIYIKPFNGTIEASNFVAIAQPSGGAPNSGSAGTFNGIVISNNATGFTLYGGSSTELGIGLTASNTITFYSGTSFGSGGSAGSVLTLNNNLTIGSAGTLTLTAVSGGSSVTIPASGTLITSTPSGQQLISGAASSAGLRIQANATGTPNIAEWYGSGASIGTLTVVSNGGTSTSSNSAYINSNAVFYGDGSGLVNIVPGGINGIIPMSKGGTGANLTGAAGAIVYTNGTTTMAVNSAASAAGIPLLSGTSGTGTPTFTALNLAGGSNVITGTLPIGNGGTGTAVTPTQYGVIYASTASAYASTAAGTNTTVLIGNASGAPSFGSVNLTSMVTGTLPIANGGTNSTTAASAGAVIYSSASAFLPNTPAGSAGIPLVSGTSGTGAPTFSALNLAGGATIVTGTLPVGNGGTGQSSFSSTNSLLVSGSTSTGGFATVTGAAGILYGTAANTAPTFATSIGTAITFSAGLSLTGGTNSISVTPVNANDIVNKAYVDSVAQGISVRVSVRAASISSFESTLGSSLLGGAITGAWYNAGTVTWNGVTYTGYITTTLTTPTNLVGGTAASGSLNPVLYTAFDSPSGTSSTLNLGDRVLIKDFSNSSTYNSTGGTVRSSANGIYVVITLGGGGPNFTIAFARALDCDTAAELSEGVFAFIEEGSTQATTGWIEVDITTNIVPATAATASNTPQFTQFTGAGDITATMGLQKSTNTIGANVNITSSTTSFSLGGNAISPFSNNTNATLTITSASAGTIILTQNTSGWSLAAGSTNVNTLTLNQAGSATYTINGTGGTLTLSNSGSVTCSNSGSLTITGTGGTLTISNSASLTATNSGIITITGTGGTVSIASNLTIASSSAVSISSTVTVASSSAVSISSPLTIAASSTISISSPVTVASSSTVGISAPLTIAANASLSTSVLGGASASTGGILISNNIQGTNSSQAALSLNSTSGALALAGFTLTLGSNSTLSTNGQTLTLSASIGNITFGAGVGTSATTHNLVQSGVTQYVLETATAPTALGDMYYASTSSYATMTKLNIGVRGSVLVVNSSTPTPTWLSPSAIAGVPLISGGTGADLAYGTVVVQGGGTGATTFTANGVLYGNSTSAIQATAQGGTNTILTANNGSPSFSATPIVNTSIQIGVAGSTTGQLKLGNATGSNLTTIQAGASAPSVTYTLPTTAPTLNQVLQSDASGNLSWVTPSGGTITGTGTSGQVTYWNGTSSVTGSSGFTYSGNILTVSGTSGSAIVSTVTGLATSSVQGMALSNTTVSTSGATQQQSPAFDFIGHAWNTTPTAADNFIRFRTELQVTSASTPSGLLVWKSSIDTGTASFNNAMTLTTGGSLTVASALTAGNSGFSTTANGNTTIAPSAAGSTTLTLKTNATDNNSSTVLLLSATDSTGTSKASLTGAGSFRATTKSFAIPHPTKPNKTLVYGCLEGPEHGVYHRDTIEGKGKIRVDLPEYWYALCQDANYSIQLTGWNGANISIVDKDEKGFVVQLNGFLNKLFNKKYKFEYTVIGARELFEIEENN